MDRPTKLNELPEPSFVDDLRFAAATWRRFPWLPAVSVGLAVASGGFLANEGPLPFLALAASIFGLGWIGLERICYLRAARGLDIGRSEVGRFTTAFIMRYFVLALIGVVFLIPLMIVFWPDRSIDGVPAFGRSYLLATSVLGLVGDVALTFVTSALAFTTRRVSVALRLGLRMIRSEWPRCLPYISVPPLVLVLGSRVLNSSGETAIAVFASALGALASLWFKGAIAAFYLRRHWVGDDGAAFIDAPASAPVIGDIPARPDL